MNKLGCFIDEKYRVGISDFMVIYNNSVILRDLLVAYLVCLFARLLLPLVIVILIKVAKFAFKNMIKLKKYLPKKKK